MLKNTRRLEVDNLEPTEEDGHVMIINLQGLDDIEMEDGELVKVEETDETEEKNITVENKNILEGIDDGNSTKMKVILNKQ